MSRQEIILHRQATNRLGIGLLIGWFLPVLALLAGDRPFKRWLAQQAFTPDVKLTCYAGYGVAFLVILLGLPWVFVWLLNRRQRPSGLDCPNCKTDLSASMAGTIAIATGHCGDCGHLIFDAQSERSAKGTMTKSEFLERHQAFQRAGNRFAALWLPVFLGFLFVNIPISSWIERHANPTMHLAYAIAMPCAFAGLIGWLVMFGMKQRRSHGLLCPSCGKAMTGVSAQITTATGNCSHCGVRVLSDQSSSVGHPNPAAPTATPPL
jgi:transcription elongation factor Elf1